LQGME